MLHELVLKHGVLFFILSRLLTVVVVEFGQSGRVFLGHPIEQGCVVVYHFLPFFFQMGLADTALVFLFFYLLAQVQYLGLLFLRYQF